MYIPPKVPNLNWTKTRRDAVIKHHINRAIQIITSNHCADFQSFPRSFENSRPNSISQSRVRAWTTESPIWFRLTMWDQIPNAKYQNAHVLRGVVPPIFSPVYPWCKSLWMPKAESGGWDSSIQPVEIECVDVMSNCAYQFRWTDARTRIRPTLIVGKFISGCTKSGKPEESPRASTRSKQIHETNGVNVTKRVTPLHDICRKGAVRPPLVLSNGSATQIKWPWWRKQPK